MIVALSRVTRQGQISVPAEVRKDLDVHPGTELIWERRENGEYVVRPKRLKLEDIHRMLADTPVPVVHLTDAELQQARKEFLRHRWNRLEGEM